MSTNHTPEYISHPLLKEGVVERRRYQIAIAREARKKSLMVVLPTGLGKTTIALFVLTNRLAKGKVLFLAPTRPLVEQHSAFLNDVLNINPSVIQKLTGNVLADKRAKLWDDAKIIVSTPQIIENDLLSNRIDLSTVSLIIFDECHRAVGNYSYVYIAEKYAEQAIEPLVLGMTASPGSDKEKIKGICISLGVKKVESRTEYDSDVAQYIHKKDIEWRTLDVPVAIKKQKRILDAVLDERIGELQKLGYVRKKRGKDVTKKELLELRKIITVQLATQKHADLYKALSLQAEVLKIKHAIDLIETQGIFAVNRYFGRLKNEALSKDGSKAAKRLLRDERFVNAMNMAASYEGEHPKLNAVIQILQDEFRVNPNTRIIVFTNYRDTAEMIISGLQDQNSEEEGIRAVKFIGQASKAEDKGLKQKEQVEIITKFKAGDYNVLVATSVAEEGLDIPATDLVLFYEPIPSAIRSIQRKGRTARKKVGKVIVLIAKGTKDEAYYWLSRSKEREMRKRISEMRMIEIETEKAVTETGNKTENKGDEDQSRITDFEDELKLTVFVDPRETRAGIARFLQKAGVDLKLQNLEIGDYIVSDKVCIERKTVTDFLDTLINKRRNLFEQIHRMKNEYEKPLLVIEGDSIYGQRHVHPNVVRAVMASIAIDYSVPIIQTRDAADTASLIYVIAKREQMPNKTEVNPHGKKPTASLKEQQEYFVSALSNIGIMTTRKLLAKFKTIERIMAASKEELMEVENVGAKTAEHIKRVFSTEYNG
uniref:ATP-dependent RNA helicase SrmB n=1 Tax=Candidatus Methanophaga sp. ANME-1 ERB7 TaxID=2759913 RepID=A0A7G9ZAY1_9EURY|nr:ATP-dependent RNA helicase SrmB [Methanosarcinales archaeon ANME-1 ERB7]